MSYSSLVLVIALIFAAIDMIRDRSLTAGAAFLIALYLLRGK